MFCVHCGAKIEDGARVCPVCNKSVGASVVEKNKKPFDFGKLLTILDYVSIGLMCLAMVYVALSVMCPYMDPYSARFSWYPHHDYALPGVLFASIAYIVAQIRFTFVFFPKCKEKRFQASVIFMVALTVLAISIICVCFAKSSSYIY